MGGCFIDNVLHILDPTRNLLLVSKLNDSRMHVTFGKRRSQIETLFKLHASTIFNSTFVTRIENACILWHHRLGHIGEKGLKIILNKKLVEGIF